MRISPVGPLSVAVPSVAPASRQQLSSIRGTSSSQPPTPVHDTVDISDPAGSSNLSGTLTYAQLGFGISGSGFQGHGKASELSLDATLQQGGQQIHIQADVAVVQLEISAAAGAASGSGANPLGSLLGQPGDAAAVSAGDGSQGKDLAFSLLDYLKQALLTAGKEALKLLTSATSDASRSADSSSSQGTQGGTPTINRLG